MWFPFFRSYTSKSFKFQFCSTIQAKTKGWRCRFQTAFLLKVELNWFSGDLRCLKNGSLTEIGPDSSIHRPRILRILRNKGDALSVGVQDCADCRTRKGLGLHDCQSWFTMLHSVSGLFRLWFILSSYSSLARSVIASHTESAKLSHYLHTSRTNCFTFIRRQPYISMLIFDYIFCGGRRENCSVKENEFQHVQYLSLLSRTPMLYS